MKGDRKIKYPRRNLQQYCPLEQGLCTTKLEANTLKPKSSHAFWLATRMVPEPSMVMSDLLGPGARSAVLAGIHIADRRGQH